jgi:hypothetical protein
MKVIVWGEEGKKCFIFRESGCLNSSLALDAEKKLCESKSSGLTDLQLHNAVAVVLRKNFPLN